MSNYPFFQCWIVVDTLFICYQSVEAGFHQDRNRVILTYNTDTDPCFRLSTDPTQDILDSANLACLWAFEALDRLEGNACSNWRRAECRQLQLPEFDYYECSCKNSNCDPYEIRNDEVSSFHDCAWKLYTQEILSGGQPPLPSLMFQREYQKVYDRAVQKSRFRHAARTSPEASTSHVPPSLWAGGTLSPSGNQSGRNTSWSTQITNYANTSQGAGSSVNPVLAPVTTDRRQVCDICGREYASAHTLKYHKRYHEMNLRCDDCNTSYSTIGNFNLHRKKFHPNPAESADEAHPCQRGPSSAVDPATPKEAHHYPHKCEVCKKSYKHARSLTVHKKVHKKGIRCQFCNYVASSKSSHTKHMNQSHPEIVRADTAKKNARQMTEKPYKCDECDNRFATIKTLQQHEPVHRGETYCQQCNITFPRRTLLNKHKRKEHP